MYTLVNYVYKCIPIKEVILQYNKGVLTMADKTDKVCSIRTDEDTLAKFKEMCEQYSNQSECLQALINSHELSLSKEILPGQKSSIEDFQSRVEGLVRSYINALDMSANAEERIRLQFAEQLASKDKVIISLQERAQVAEENLNSAADDFNSQIIELKSQVHDLMQENQKLSVQADSSESSLLSARQTIQDKQMIIDNLSSRLPDQSITDQQISNYKKEIEELESAVKNKNNEISDLQIKINDMSKQCELAEKSHLVEVKNAVLDTKTDYQDKISAYVEKCDQQRETIYNLHEEILKLQSELDKSNTMSESNNVIK